LSQAQIINFYFYFHHQLAEADGSNIPQQCKALFVSSNQNAIKRKDGKVILDHTVPVS